MTHPRQTPALQVGEEEEEEGRAHEIPHLPRRGCRAERQDNRTGIPRYMYGRGPGHSYVQGGGNGDGDGDGDGSRGHHIMIICRSNIVAVVDILMKRDNDFLLQMDIYTEYSVNIYIHMVYEVAPRESRQVHAKRVDSWSADMHPNQPSGHPSPAIDYCYYRVCTSSSTTYTPYSVLHMMMTGRSGEETGKKPACG